jgi:uncharacterized membrane protein YgdD (TMEM256/DUF423 family)
MTNRTLQKQMFRGGAFFAATAIALGAFGAHQLKSLITGEDLAVFETAVRYQMYHGIALFVMSGMIRRLDEVTAKQVFRLFIGGIILFSGSLYLLSVREMAFGVSNFLWLGALTPLGGACLIAGWGMLVYKGYKVNDGSESSSSSITTAPRKKKSSETAKSDAALNPS